jgi:adenylate cyclase
LEIQEQVRDHEKEREPEQRFQFRIGINVGDVIASDDDIHGDGVNVAARLEALAEPGGILVAANAHAMAVGRVKCTFEDAGEQRLKNIAAPVRAYRVIQAAEPERPPLLLPDKPSIAVLPFQNMSGDPEQEYFADGMVEEIITGLSRVRSFFVIARNSSFTYRGRAVDVKQVGRELGVRYALEGSVRKSGSRVRITGQLVDASSGAHVWADRFEGTLEDVFALQDRVTSSVVAVIVPEIYRAEIQRAQRSSTGSQSAYDLLLRAQPHFHLRSRESVKTATRLLSQAAEIDPAYALACAQLALCYWVPWQQGWTEEERRPLDEIVRLAQVAVQQGGEDDLVIAIAGLVIAYAGRDAPTGLALIEKALALNPNAANALVIAGELRAYLGDAEAAVQYIEQSVRLNPLADTADMAYRNLAFCVAHFVAGRYSVALDFAEKALRDSSNLAGAMRWRIACLGLLGRGQEGQEAMRQLDAFAPGWTVSRWRALTAIKVPEVVDAVAEGMRRSGMPE